MDDFRREYGTEASCPKAPSGHHEANPSTITLSSDNGEYYLDVLCLHCFRSGCIAGPKRIQEMAAEVSW